MNFLNIPIDVDQLLLFLKQQLTYTERKKIAKLLTEKETGITLRDNKFTDKKKVYFTILHTDIKNYKFNRDEANQR